jgi:hypothetical protein
MDPLIAGAQEIVERFGCTMAEAIDCFTAALDAHDEQAEADEEARKRPDLRLIPKVLET